MVKLAIIGGKKSDLAENIISHSPVALALGTFFNGTRTQLPHLQKVGSNLKSRMIGED